MALPFLESLADTKDLKNATSKRLVFMGGGFGLTEESFYPDKEGRFSDIGMTTGLKPMERHKDELLMVHGLFNPKLQDPHAGSFGYLSGTKLAVSCDQVAGQYFGKFSRYPTLVLTSTGDRSGHGRGGLSLSNGPNGKPIAGIKSPIDLFYELFGDPKQSPKDLQAELAKKHSILDIVSVNGNDLKRRLSSYDKDRVGEYFQSIRDIELNLQRQAEWSTVPKPKAPFKAPAAGLSGEEEIKLMLDMIIIALQTDSTRVASYRIPMTSLLKSLEIGISPHAMSHYKFSAAKRVDSEKRDKRLMEFFAYFIDRLKETEDKSGKKLFDSTIASFGGNLRTGHTTHNCPALIIGGSTKFKKGHHVMLKSKTHMTDYWLTVLNQAGINISQFNDSTGVISDILT